MVFNDTFGNVQYIYYDEDSPVLWNDFALVLFTHQVLFEPGYIPVIRD